MIHVYKKTGVMQEKTGNKRGYFVGYSSLIPQFYLTESNKMARPIGYFQLVAHEL